MKQQLSIFDQFYPHCVEGAHHFTLMTLTHHTCWPENDRINSYFMTPDQMNLIEHAKVADFILVSFLLITVFFFIFKSNKINNRPLLNGRNKKKMFYEKNYFAVVEKSKRIQVSLNFISIQ